MNNKKMRIKEVGATINLGNYSSLHVTIGESQEYAGLDIGRAEDYLRKVAESVEGTLNLPEKKEKTVPKAKDKTEILPVGEKVFSFGGTDFAFYDHASHQYTSKDGVPYVSVTQMLSDFYPFNAKKAIKQEYMDFAASYGNMIHTAIQNAVVGMPPTKTFPASVAKSVLAQMGDFDKAFVEHAVLLPDQEIAGRFDILTEKDGKYTLWDVKTNTEIFAPSDCTLPQSLQLEFGKHWNVGTIYGEHCLQLNVYAYILEHTTDITIDEIKIIHVPDDFKEILPVPKIDISPIFQAFGAIR